MEAIGPYLAPLPNEQQQSFRLQLGERTFGREDVSATGRLRKKSPANSLDLLKESKEYRELLREILADVAKTIKS